MRPEGFLQALESCQMWESPSRATLGGLSGCLWETKWQCQLLSSVWLFVTQWTVACQTLLSMGLPRQNIGVGCHFLLQGIFPTQGSNMGLLHCSQTLYHLSYNVVCSSRPLFLPAKSYRQRSLLGYSPWGCNEDTILVTKSKTTDLSLTCVYYWLGYFTTL